MHKSAIKELIFENSTFMENIPSNNKYHQLLDKSIELYTKLKESLNEEQLKLLDELVNSQAGMQAESDDCHLLKGFKTGLRLIIECL
ncbi:MAG: hypothetical protein K2L12_01360 [Clostridia bacterium]|nr:hypothetical protein [Clostridia bacterium]